jgi:acyl-CoA thioester hydrolase
MAGQQGKKKADPGVVKDSFSIRVRFSEVDALGIVWHGNFVKYLEDGRESFGRRFGLGYQEVYDRGWSTPLVRLEMDYKEQVRYGDELIIETSWVPCDAAKIIFEYRILRKSDHSLVLTAGSTQVFMNRNGELELCTPDFYREWKEEHGPGPGKEGRE